MAETQQGTNGEMHSPEIVEVEPAETALVASGAELKRGRVGRWWKRVVESGTQGASGLSFPGLERLRKLEEEQRALANAVEERVRESEARSIQRLEERLEELEAERSERLESQLAEGLAAQRSRLAVLATLTAAAGVAAVLALLLTLGILPF